MVGFSLSDDFIIRLFVIFIFGLGQLLFCTTLNTIPHKLLRWHQAIDRDMPWKKTTDPYKIWLSEIILQQTRVAQGLPYYLKFVDHYPTVVDLAEATIDDVLKDWQGLGYYSRARNLHHAANTVVEVFGGVFPKEYKDVLSLKGIGKYTAAAIMSFAYGASYPVVDGNVLRVISRLHGIHEAIDDRQTIAKIYELSESYISEVDPAKYNQAIMDLGALVCTPKKYNCDNCPFMEDCLAKSKDTIAVIPYKAKKIKKKTRYIHYLDISLYHSETIIHHRKGKGIWQGLYDLPMLETKNNDKITKSDISEYLTNLFGKVTFKLAKSTKQYKHILTHQTLHVTFHRVDIKDEIKVKPPYLIIKEKEREQYGGPIVVVNYFKE